MKNLNYLFLVPVFAMFFSCSKDETNEPVLTPVADFETEKQYYDDGEVIGFVNKSENANSYLWTFGGDETSEEENPTYSAELHHFLGHRFSVTLKAFAEDGRSDSITKYFAISKRILHDIEITGISEEIRNLIPYDEEINTQLIVYMGPANDPLEWIVPEQTLPPRQIEKDFEIPFTYNVMISWPSVGMNNADWILRLSAQLEGDLESRVMLKEFYFNPSETDFENGDEHIKTFTLSDEDMHLNVLFYYISI